MISYMLFAIKLSLASGKAMEISAEDLCYDGCTFRLTAEDAAQIGHSAPVSCLVTFRNMRESLHLTLRDFSLQREDDCFRLITVDPEYHRLSRQLMREIQTYTQRKNAGEDAELSAFYTGYPADRERQFAKSFYTWRRRNLAALAMDASWYDRFRQIPELVLCLSSLEKAKYFLQHGIRESWNRELETAGLGKHPMADRIPDGIAFGNLYCPHLLPEEETCGRILAQCDREKCTPMLMLPPVTENRIDETKRLLEAVAEKMKGHPWRLMLGDTGMAQMVRELGLEHMEMIAGPLLTRRRKDPRLEWWTGEKEQLRQTSSGSRILRDWYAGLGISSMCGESCGYLPAIEPGDCMITPFYQLNTATSCTLRAVCEHGNRGDQRDGSDCSGWCRERCFLYGEHLNMAGCGNTLFGLDTRLLHDGEALLQLIQAGLKCLMIELL